MRKGEDRKGEDRKGVLYMKMSKWEFVEKMSKLELSEVGSQGQGMGSG